MPPITDNELRNIAYELLRAATKAIIATHSQIEQLNKKLENLEENIKVATEIIERLVPPQEYKET